MTLVPVHLRVPMAAPETPLLRTLRLCVMGCCAALALVLVGVQLVGADAAAWLRAAAVGAGAGLLVALALLVPVYVVAKNRADDAHLLATVAREDGA